MKLNREDIPKIIKILQDKYENTNPGDIIYDLNFNLIKEKEFIIPEEWRLEKTSNEKYWKIMKDWISIPGNVLKGHAEGLGWDLNYSENYIIHYNTESKYFHGNQTDDGTLISWEDFIKYIAKV